MNHFDRIEANEVQKVLEIGSRFSTLILDAQALAKSPMLPPELREALEEFVRYCDDTLADCSLSAAVDRYDEGAPQREADALAYERDQIADMIREERVAMRRPQAAE